MWSNLLYMAPVINILYKYTISEEVKMEGNVGDELTKLFKKYLVGSNLHLRKMKIRANINASYPIGTSLWTILDSIITRFHLNAIVDKNYNGEITLKLEEGVLWRR